MSFQTRIRFNHDDDQPKGFWKIPADPSIEAGVLPGYYDSDPETDLFAANKVLL